ncbi:MAG TPA: MFS transporter [Actinomycetota bacterium]
MVQRARGSIRRLAAASAVSNIGNWAASVALALAIFAKTDSTVWLSASFLFTQLPSALAAPLGGLIADRLNRQRVMIVCDLAGAACYVGMALVTSPAALIALGSVAALLHMPFGPASRAAVPNLVEEDDLSWANGTLAAAGNVGNLIGPAVGGALFALTGAGSVFWANAVSFVASALLIATMRGRFAAERDTKEERPRGAIWEGVRFIWHHPTLLTLTAIGAITYIATEVTWVADLPLIHHFGVGGVGYGVMNMVWGAGGLLGGLVAARVVTKAKEPAAAVYGTLVFGAFVGAVGVAPWFGLIPAFLFVLAFADSFAFVGFNGIYQRDSPDAIRGRVFAAVGGVMTLATAVGFTFAGFLVQATGWRPVFVVGGLIDVACALVLGFVLLGRSATSRVAVPSGK